ncbi:hypothetical protein Gohar_027088 [Gossypium harknessii]|uniref:RNase H type-1 domain-containing protein n=1 Tax=Gossypium harknessii TaxID=34285 RepID=A0A7J9HTM7_9ROSI|nr:hypothetical protein [Gossypium harknessii]
MTLAGRVLKKLTHFRHFQRKWSVDGLFSVFWSIKVPATGCMTTGWSLPTGTSAKINFDATFDLRQYRFGLGMVIRDANGGVLASKFILNRDVSSPFATEALACS